MSLADRRYMNTPYTRAPGDRLYGRPSTPRWSRARTVTLIVGTLVVLGFALMSQPIRDRLLPVQGEGWRPGVHCPDRGRETDPSRGWETFEGR